MMAAMTVASMLGLRLWTFLPPARRFNKNLYRDPGHWHPTREEEGLRRGSLAGAAIMLAKPLSENSLQKEEAPEPVEVQGLSLVAGAGFRPATFGL